MRRYIVMIKDIVQRRKWTFYKAACFGWMTRPFSGLFGPVFIPVLLLSIVPVISWAKPLSLQDYRDRLQRTIGHLQSLEGTVSQDETAWVRDRFPPGLKVRLPGNAAIPVDAGGILRWLPEEGAPAAERAKLRRHLSAVLAQIGEPAPGGPLSALGPKDRRAALARVYSRKPFRDLESGGIPPWQTFLKRILDSLGAWLRGHLPALESVEWGWMVYPFYAVVLILTGLLLAWIFRYVRPAARRREKSGHFPSRTAVSMEPDWIAWRQTARKKAEQGAFREAIRALFLSVLMEGGQRGWWNYDPGATNREHLAAIREPVERRVAMRSLVSIHERTWYGMGPAGEKDYRASEEWVRRMGAVP